MARHGARLDRADGSADTEHMMKHLADWILDQASLLVPCLFAGAFVALIGGEVYDRIREQP